jgi:hypothetical protein
MAWPEECKRCGETIEYTRDDDGLWAECDCDSGYVD